MPPVATQVAGAHFFHNCGGFSHEISAEICRFASSSDP